MRHVAMYDFDVVPVDEENKCERSGIQGIEIEKKEIELVKNEFFERTNRIISAKYPQSNFCQNPSCFEIEEDDEEHDFFNNLDKQIYFHKGPSGVTYKVTLHILFLY